MEIELKSVLRGEAEASRLRALLGVPERVLLQDNLYFDSEGAWAQARFGVRVRRSGEGPLTLTVKGPATSVGDFVARGEWEVDLPRARWDGLRSGREPLAAELAALLARDHVELPAGLPLAVVPFGFTDTHREVYVLPGDGPALHLELDRTRYPDESVSYEVELEIPAADLEPGARARLEALLARAGVPYRPSTVSKLHRLHEVIDRARQGFTRG
jgi:inorganic triphosphatase YgiF